MIGVSSGTKLLDIKKIIIYNKRRKFILKNYKNPYDKSYSDYDFFGLNSEKRKRIPGVTRPLTARS